MNAGALARGLVGVLALTGVLAGSVGQTPAARAAVGSRGDPIVVLSNGIVLDVTADIGAASTDIKLITYQITIPRGIAVADAISTDGSIGAHEKFTVNATGKTAGTYAVSVFLKTGAKNPAVTATIHAGYASALGITSAMVGLASFTWTSISSATGQVTAAGLQGPQAPSPLPTTVTTNLASWATVAAWTSTNAAQGVSAASASVTL